MKASSRVSVLMIIGCSLMWLNLLEDRLGIAPWGIAFALIGLLFILAAVRVAKKVRQRRDASLPVQTGQQYARRMILAAVVLVLSSLSAPFLMPQLGLHLPLRTQVITSLVTCVLMLVFVVVVARNQRQKFPEE